MATMSPTKATERFLRLIATHLANRKECKGVIYRMNIHSDGLVEFYPSIQVYPSRHTKKKEDMQDVVRHVLIHHMSDLHILDDELSQANYPDCYIHPSKMLPGGYVYQKSFTSARRTWIAV